MRFSAPRSCSPSPVRGKTRSSSTFGLQSDSESEDYDSELDSGSSSDEDDDTISIASSSSSENAFSLVSDLNRLAIRPRHIVRSAQEERQIQDTVSAIRLRARYHDPYEEWEKQTRRDAFRTARRELSEKQKALQLNSHDAENDAQQQRIHAEQSSEVERALNFHRQQQLQHELKLKETWVQRDRQLWSRIESVIKMEEKKVADRLEEERMKREEEERIRQEAELKKHLAEEKKLQEETAKRKAEEGKKRREEEEARKEKEEDERREKLEEDRKKRLREEVELRKMLAFNPADDDWRVARENLRKLKSGPMAYVKGQKELKSAWAKLRRQIVPKIGQLTNDAQAISQISRQLIEIVRPSNGPQHNDSIYIALCSSLAKSILLQAETEVTAEKRSAIPLAQVAFTLLETLDHFPSIFFAKLMQRCGGWPVPYVTPKADFDNKPWASQEDFRKASGFRKSESGEGLESQLEYSNRVSAMMRVYFHILKIRPLQKPLDPMFQLPRYWTWFARILGDPRLLQDAVAPQLIYTGLDVMGSEATEVWGKQWVKVLALVYESITTGYEDGKLIGGESAEGSAARTRVMLALEDIVSGRQSSAGPTMPVPQTLFS